MRARLPERSRSEAPGCCPATPLALKCSVLSSGLKAMITMAPLGLCSFFAHSQVTPAFPREDS
jgi:hypothetical protein